MTAPQTDATTDPHTIIAALQQRLDAALARETALAEELATRNSEYGERIEQQAATIDVLKAMSASPDDARPVFELIVERARSFCGADHATAALLQDDMLHLQAHSGMSAAYGADYAAQFPRPVDTSTMFGRAILSRDVMQTGNVRAERDHFARQMHTVDFHSIVAVPIFREGTPIGAIALGQNASGGFTDTQIELLKTFAEQAVIAIISAETYRSLQTRTADLQQSLEYQAATIDVLKVMSSSTGDTRPVFEIIVGQAMRLSNGTFGALFEYDGEQLHVGVMRGFAQDALEAYASGLPRQPDRSNVMDRAILDQQTIYVPDYHAANPEAPQVVRDLGYNSFLAVPLRREGTVLGVIVVAHKDIGAFTDAQIELVKTFAEQAVIAIGSTATFRALQTRTSDLQESLEYQTATSDVLKVISRSAFDLQPVLATLLKTAARLCDAETAGMTSREGDTYRVVATFSNAPAFDTFIQGQSFTANRASVTGRTALEGHIIHIADLAADPEYAVAEAVTLGGVRTLLGVPLLREGEVAGVIILGRLRVEPFTDRQIELVSTFADQAVIAIENTRLITEQREALEQQTATAEVLQVINASPGNLAPVFETILEKGTRLCGAAFGWLTAWDGEYSNVVAIRGFPPALAEYIAAREPRLAVSPVIARLAETKRSQQLPDVTAGEGYRNGHPDSRAVADLGGARTLLHVPLCKDEAMLGYITVYRTEVRLFSDKEIALLENFAAQAVIAMENARLITEQREALEQQTATAEVLQVINASPGNLVPVFDAILNKAHALCGATMGNLTIYKDGYFQALATHGHPEEIASLLRQPFRPNPAIQDLIDGARFHHIEDIRAIEISSQGPITRALVAQTDVRTVLFVPLRKDGALLGLITAHRPEVRPFSDKEIALLENFGAQAVVAMENARLLTEQQEALEQQTATAEVLQVINASPGDLTPVFDAMLEKATRLCEGAQGILWTYDGETFRPAATFGLAPEFADFLNKLVRPGSGTPIGRVLGGERLVQAIDLAADPSYQAGDPLALAAVEIGATRTLVIVALVKDEALLGAFAISRREVRPFTDKQIALLQNFAAQAVIAMENARLIEEQREALEQQTATAEVLQVINASPGDLTPVFDAVLEKAVRLCESEFGIFNSYDGECFHVVATRGVGRDLLGYLRQPFRSGPGTALLKIVQGENVVNIADITDDDGYRLGDSMRRAVADVGGARSQLMVALRKEENLLGAINIFRQEVRPFSDKQIALARNFAAQAVIAMENARLINEQREALEQQTATAEVLQVINASPGNLSPVFDAMLDKACHLCEAEIGALWIYEDEHMRASAIRGAPSAYAEFLRRGSPHPISGEHKRLLSGERFIHTADITDTETYRSGHPVYCAAADLGGVRTFLGVPLRKDEQVLGHFGIYRQEVRPFTDKQIALLQNFAAQAVIAMENARLLDEIRQRQAELRTTFDNMGDGVAMFDADLRLAAWNRNFQRIIDLPDTLLAERASYADYLRMLTDRGEFGATGIEAELSRRVEDTEQELRLERVRPDGRVIEVRRNAVPGGGFVLIYSDITERKRSEEEIRAARDAAETALRELRTAQANLIQAEKMASLGQLTAGIAHEIKNPLNFVNNFSALSTELIDELRDVLAPEPLGETARTEVDDLTALLKGNPEKVVQHGQRADGIVRSMLDHSRGSSGERRMVDLNALIDEALNLAYHGARAQDQSFNISLERDFGEGIAPIEVNPQDMTRVFLNIFANGFYATTRRARDGGDAGFEPTLKVTTRDAGEAVEIRVRDNGTGIPADIRDKLFQPFFTTKPTGEGTGLGLSITYDIVTQQHGGNIAVDSKVGEYSEFTIRLPRYRP